MFYFRYSGFKYLKNKLENMRKRLSQIMPVALLFLVIGIFIGISLTNLTPPTTIITTTTTTIIDCSTMDPNYCNTDDDCICSMSKCFRGNKDYAEYCVQEAEVCPMNYCFFASGESMVCAG